MYTIIASVLHFVKGYFEFFSKKGMIPAVTPFFSAIAGISYYFTVQEPATICLRRIMSNTFGTVSERTSAA